MFEFTTKHGFLLFESNRNVAVDKSDNWVPVKFNFSWRWWPWSEMVEGNISIAFCAEQSKPIA